MPDLTYATRVLLRAISDLPENQPVHADTVREALDAAELTSAERGGAFNAACTYGYLRSIHDHLADGTPVFWCVPSRSEGRKSGHNLLYARTSQPVPEHVCGANVVGSQQDTCDNGGSKTAPGVASTNTESLAPIPHYRKEA